MSISPGIPVMPLIDGSGFGAPSSLPTTPGAGGGSPAASQADFSSMLGNGAAGSPVQDAAFHPPAYRPGAISHEVRPGEQILRGLEKLGRSIEAMDKAGEKKPVPPAPSSKAAPPGKTATQGTDNAMNEMEKLAYDAMNHQRQAYAKAFEFEVIQGSAQSMLKSLKSLLTQGGG